MSEFASIQKSEKSNNNGNHSDNVTQKKSNIDLIIQRVKANPATVSKAEVAQLQKNIGNRAVAQLLKGSIVQREAGKGEEEEEVLQGKFQTIQLVEEEEEEPLQGKFDTIQRIEEEEEEPVQGKFETVQRLEDDSEGEIQMNSENNTGLSDSLKSGVEQLSGLDMSDVRVHYNSNKPAEVGALAYTQGTDIHVAPGEERHLPHEAWHVVQQAQGRVNPTKQLKGVDINDDESLEREADNMGEVAARTVETPMQ